MRKLIYVPVIHTEADMGSAAEPLKTEYVKRYGLKGWDEHTSAIDSMWRGIRQKIFDLALDYDKMKIYQDGLPVCGKESAIVRDLAQAGNENYKIIWELTQRGARLVGTEDAKLLLEEYNYIKAVTEINDSEEKEKAIKEYQEKALDILKRRDEFIAQRINQTLMEGETGILFMGMKHQVDEQLPEDMEIRYLIYRLPFKESDKTQRKLQK